MSTTEVSDSYRNLMNKSNPNSPFNLYGSSQSIRVKILSIVLNDSGISDGRNSSATVRFQRFLLNKSTGVSRFIDSNVATLTYTYKNNLKMEEKYRLKIRLVFKSYPIELTRMLAQQPLERILETIPLLLLLVQRSMNQILKLNLVILLKILFEILLNLYPLPQFPLLNRKINNV